MTFSLLEISLFYTFQSVFLSKIFFLSFVPLLLFQNVTGSMSPTALNCSHLRLHKNTQCILAGKEEVLIAFMLCGKCCQGAQRKVWGETVLGPGPISFRQVLLNCSVFVVYYFELSKNVSNKFF